MGVALARQELAELLCGVAPPGKKTPRSSWDIPNCLGTKTSSKGRNLLVYTTQALSVPALRQGVIVPSMLGITVKTKQQNIQQVRIIPRIGFYVVEVIYERAPVQAAVDPALHAGWILVSTIWQR